MKGCKLTHAHTQTHTQRHTHTRTHTHIHTYTEVDFSLQFVFTDHAGFFKCQMSKESLITLSNVLFHVFTKLKQYEQLPKNYDSNFKMHWDLLLSSI